MKALRIDLARVDALLAPALERPAAARGEPSPIVRIDPGCELPGLRRATELFGLSSFERDVLLLALAAEVDDRYGRTFATLNADPARRRPTVGLAVRLLCDDVGGGHELAAATLGPGCHLYRHGLIDIVGEGPHATREVRLPPTFWPALAGFPSTPPFAVTPSRAAAIARLVLDAATERAVATAIAWARRTAAAQLLLTFSGPDGTGRRTIAHAVAHELGHASIEIAAAALEHEDVLRDLGRETAWHRAAVVVLDGAPAATIARLCAHVATPVLVLGRAPAEPPRPMFEVAVPQPDRDARERLWTRTLAAHGHAEDVDPIVFASRYRFGPGRVITAVERAGAIASARGERIGRADLIEACRAIGGLSLGSMAQRLDASYRPGDLVLPATVRRELDLIMSWARHGAHVFRDGGAGGRAHAREGFVCLFAGPPGTGKTMATQIIAGELGLELWRIDLSQVINKYIGETEKNLDRVFADAEAGGTILLFDEADALFGRRTDVKHAHDRYANVETAFLLQRLESHRGIVVLATNLNRNLDEAFLRRIHVVAEFPMPGPDERAQIWERHLVASHLGDDVDLPQLGQRFALAGGDIRNAVIAAALLAADDGCAISMRHLVLGVVREMLKAGRLMSPDDFGPWRDVALQYAKPRPR
jgi:AAA+ superfamily predicted ATPase